MSHDEIRNGGDALRSGLEIVECRAEQMTDVIKASGLRLADVEYERLPDFVSDRYPEAAHLVKPRIRMWRGGLDSGDPDACPSCKEGESTHHMMRHAANYK